MINSVLHVQFGCSACNIAMRKCVTTQRLNATVDSNALEKDFGEVKKHDIVPVDTFVQEEQSYSSTHSYSLPQIKHINSDTLHISVTPNTT
jgi:hypothetical protein